MRFHLHFDRVAPGGITLPFMIASPFFGLLAAVLLLAAGSDVLLSRWHPALIGALHVYTIGFLLFSIAGALLQIGPVVTASAALQSEKTAGWLRIAMGAGALLFGCGLFHQFRGLLVPAFILLGLALPAWFVLALRGTGFSRTSRDLLFAIAGLAIGIGIGLRLIAGHAFPELGLPRQLTDLHAGWMLLGGVAPLIMAVGVIVIPMFQHTQPLPAVVKWLPGAAFIGMLIETIPGTRHAGALLSALALFVFAIIVLFAHARRRSETPDPTVPLFAVAMCSAISGLAAWTGAIAFVQWQATLQWTGGVLLIVGFAGSSVHGMALKIVPFLVRLRLQRSLWENERPALGLPGFQQLLPREKARMLPWLQASALVLLSAAVVTKLPLLFIAGAASLALAQLALGWLVCLAVVNGVRAAADIAGTETPAGILKEGNA